MSSGLFCCRTQVTVSLTSRRSGTRSAILAATLAALHLAIARAVRAITDLAATLAALHLAIARAGRALTDLAAAVATGREHQQGQNHQGLHRNPFEVVLRETTENGCHRFIVSQASEVFGESLVEGFLAVVATCQPVDPVQHLAADLEIA